MKVIEFFGMIKSLPLDHKFPWAVPNTTGFLFYKLGHPQYFIPRRFLPKEQAIVSFDISKFVSKYNMENWAVRAVDERPNDPVDYATGVLEEVNRDGVLYTFTVDTAN